MIIPAALKPVSDLWEWQLSAACRGLDPALFFSRDRERGRTRATRERQASAVCQRCPVREQCGDFAVRIGERHGFWGGVSEVERKGVVRAA